MLLLVISHTTPAHFSHFYAKQSKARLYKIAFEIVMKVREVVSLPIDFYLHTA